MPNAKVNLLIVDDEPAIRTSLSCIFRAAGHQVRCAEDGFSALAALQQEEPDILLSDLHMPGMSGFLLLSIVRQQFPAIRVIAMSGAFSAFEDVPPGVTADAFYQKGKSLDRLLQIMEGMTSLEQPPPPRRPETFAPAASMR
jgi:CheY-like chemotaxis protein